MESPWRGQSHHAISDRNKTSLTDSFGPNSPATGEKGQINLQIVVTTTGGHSSIPPDHTSIGYLSLLLAEVERHRHSPDLTRENPFYSQLVCGAKYGKTIEKPMKHLIESSQTCDAKLRKLGDTLGQDRVQRTMVSTTQVSQSHGRGTSYWR